MEEFGLELHPTFGSGAVKEDRGNRAGVDHNSCFRQCIYGRTMSKHVVSKVGWLKAEC
jgi:hypothetical protein